MVQSRQEKGVNRLVDSILNGIACEECRTRIRRVLIQGFAVSEAGKVYRVGRVDYRTMNGHQMFGDGDVRVKLCRAERL